MRSAIASLVLLSSLAVARIGAAQPVLSDSLYLAHHPRLLFAASDLEGLRDKLDDGGPDDDAYDFLRGYVYAYYLGQPPAQLAGLFFGLEVVPAFGLAGHIELPPDSVVLAKGKEFTTYLANTYEPDFNEANTGMRLRALALGYDLFFADATEAERASIRDEIVRYLNTIISSWGYRAFEYRPYLGNHSAMFGAALGLAGICLQDEAEKSVLTEAIATADRIVTNLLAYQFDPGGSYNEGSLYALWTLRQLIYYFEARERFDGTDYSDHPVLRKVEEWLAYELLPEAGGFSLNLNDSPYSTRPFARNPTYVAWAMAKWNSGLAAWLFDHSVGQYGADAGMESDKVATILWHRPITPIQPNDALPHHRVWLQRGLYHFRSEWQTAGVAPDAVMFTFYSGKFQGGHAQEDQNTFTLQAYGTKFVIDHGAGNACKESEAHNMVFIDGRGQHNAGSSIGTDGRIAEYLLGGSADYVVGDATQAYSTYSEFNAPNVPFPGYNWSWGYHGANPVVRAYRRVLVVHGDPVPPYFMIMDDIEKDGALHNYQWRLHTHSNNTVNTAQAPWTIADAGILDIHAVDPPSDSLAVASQHFDNLTTDPNAIVLSATRTAVAPHFSFLMIPRKPATASPPVTSASYPWGCACTIDLGGGVVDTIVRNDSGMTQTHDFIQTDAVVAWVRQVDGGVSSYLAAGARSLVVDAVEYVTIYDEPATCEMSGQSVRIDRGDADFRFFDSGITQVYHRDEPIAFVSSGGYVIPPVATDVDAARAAVSLRVSAHPNPFNPATTIRITGTVRDVVKVEVYDVRGAVVRRLWNAPLPAAGRLEWNGRDDAGRVVASGTYFLRAATKVGTSTLKLTLLK